MCDTVVAVRDGNVLFGKNSDRDANEGQNLVWHAACVHPADAVVSCTHVRIPEVRSTYAVLLSQPFWMWGAEMGTNEHGVAIGNEAVFTNQPYSTEPALLGMDLVRLGLERGATASEAVNVMLELLERHGQGGPCGYESSTFTYHNSFIVADPREAYVLETAGKFWAIERVGRSVRTISNALTIPGFCERYTDAPTTQLLDGETRQRRTSELAESVSDAEGMMRLLQDHGSGDGVPRYSVENGAMTAPCVHAGGDGIASQTTASWVSQLGPDCFHWATGTAAPCISLYKPVSTSEPVRLVRAGGTVDGSDWWRHERLHRRVMRDPKRARSLFDGERVLVQGRWIEDPPKSAEAFDEARWRTESWTERVEAARLRDVRPDGVRRYWAVRDSWAGMEARA